MGTCTRRWPTSACSGVAASLAALAAWLIATARTLHLRRRSPPTWTPERAGLLSLALVAVVFGVHSAIDWTWFVPAVAVTGIFCAGWVAGRGAIALTAPGTAAETPAPARLQMPRGRALRGRAALAAGAIVLAGLAAVAVAQPWRADDEGDEALALLERGGLRRRTRGRGPRTRHQPAVDRALLRAGRDRAGRRQAAPRDPPARGCGAARTREPGGVAAPRGSLRHGARSAGPRDPRAARCPLPRPDFGAESRLVSGGAARPRPEARGGPRCRPRRGRPPRGAAQGPRGAHPPPPAP